MVDFSVRLSHPTQEGVLRVSKWLKHQMLLDLQEMEQLFKALEPFYIFNVSEAVKQENAQIEKGLFLEKYGAYVDALKAGLFPEESSCKRIFSSVFTKTPDILYAMPVGQEKFLIKPVRPVIQLQLHHFFVSSIDGMFHPMVLGKESITWGLQLSYPQIYQDPKGHNFSKVIDSSDFPNTALFTTLAKWIRTYTVPTPFVFAGKKTNVPFRLGKGCFSWIAHHPGLITRGVQCLRS